MAKLLVTVEMTPQLTFYYHNLKIYFYDGFSYFKIYKGKKKKLYTCLKINCKNKQGNVHLFQDSFNLIFIKQKRKNKLKKQPI